MLLFVPSLMSAAFAAEIESGANSAVSRSTRWLRLYQYKKSGSNFRSAVESGRFFFSKDGRTNPDAELAAAIDAYAHPERTYGTQKQPAACVFPARRKILEDLLGRKFPTVACPDLVDWLERINADEADLVFVGAYAGNPASILGHTFLRLGRAGVDHGRSGQDLLSYSVGFLAQTAGDDGRLTYMVKGLTGGYPGSYEIEPHYMKVGLYNNSESRDLWELKLRLSADEVRLLVMHLWELTFNAQIPYYFIDENCSYRLLTMIEAVKPEMNFSSTLTSLFSPVVLPAETMRAVLDSGWAEPKVSYRASILRRLNYKLAKFTTKQSEEFNAESASASSVSAAQVPQVVDALLDYWLYKNYRVQAKLPQTQAAIMDATYTRAAEIKMPAGPEDKEIESRMQLRAPFQGHRPRWIELTAGLVDTKPAASLKYRSGVHPFWSTDPGYRDITAIEYLGFDLGLKEGVSDGESGAPSESPVNDQRFKWQALLIDAKSFENTFGFGHPFAWSLNIHAGNDCQLCMTDQAQLQMSGGVGIAYRNRYLVLYSLLNIQTATWWREGAQGLAAPGMEVGMRMGIGDWSVNSDGSRNWSKDKVRTEGQLRINYALDLNRSLFIKTRASNFEGGRNESEYALGWTNFFN